MDARPHGPVTLAELTSGLIWPKLLRALAISIAPSRLLLGVLTALALWGVASAMSWGWGTLGRDARLPAIVEQSGVTLLALRDAPFGGGVAPALRELKEWAIALQFPFQSARAAWHQWVTMLVLVVLWALGGGAIARSVAVDVAGDLNLSVRQSLAFALERWHALAWAVLIPLVVITLLSVAMGVWSWLTMGLPGATLVGAVLHGVTLLLALVVVLLAAIMTIGHVMLAPAIAVEGTDAADAVQRCCAYVIARPGRLLGYMLILLVIGALASGIIEWLVNAAVSAAARTVRLVSPGDIADPGVLRFWTPTIRILVLGWLVSYLHTSGTLLYLLMRRVVDEQDIREVWMPGLSPGSVAIAARAADRTEHAEGGELT